MSHHVRARCHVLGELFLVIICSANSVAAAPPHEPANSRTESDQFMMVYASNQPSQFDEAVLDRIDEMVEFQLPGEHERRKMIAQYIEKYLLNPPGRWAKKVSTVDIGDEEIERVVKETDGFSGRAISKLAIAWQAAAYGTDGAILDQESFFRTVQNHKKSMKQKDGWMKHAMERANMLTTDR